MKAVIKVSFVAIALLVGVNANAQKKMSGFGVKAGANYSTMVGDVEDVDGRVGYQFGVTLDVSISGDVYLLTGLEYTVKGYKADFEEDGVSLENTCSAQYLQMPFQLGYKLGVAKDVNMVFSFGPYFAYGLSGKTKVKGQYWNDGYYESINEKTNTFSTGMLKEFDFGFGLGVGVEYQKCGVKLGYDFGTVNAYEPIGDENNKLRNRNAYLTLGYKF